MKWTDEAPKPGDMVRVRVKFYYHYGIFVDENAIVQFGLPDNGNTASDEITVTVTDISVFSNGEFIECAKLDRADKKRAFPSEKVIENAMSRLGEKGYNILSNNCEHFANECMFGEKKSFLDDVRIKIREKLNSK